MQGSPDLATTSTFQSPTADPRTSVGDRHGAESISQVPHRADSHLEFHGLTWIIARRESTAGITGGL